ncbi:MAG TPA: hypothetical protein VH763_16930 [Gemmatimonadales bacterium]|jgi:hypothetical protein
MSRLVLVPVFLVASMFSPRHAGFGTGFAFVLPVFYGVAGFIFTAIGCAINNWSPAG